MQIQIVIKNYLRTVQLSKKQRPRYFEWDGYEIKAKRKSVFKKYLHSKDAVILNNGVVLPKHIRKGYSLGVYHKNNLVGLCSFDDPILYNGTALLPHIKFRLVNDETLEPELANSTQVNTPKEIIISGQKIYSAEASPFVRAKITRALHKELKKYIPRTVITEFPVKIHYELHDTIANVFKDIPWDLDNRITPYIKAFKDVLQDTDVIPDDDRLHVSGESYHFTPIKEGEDRKIVITIKSDNEWDLNLNKTLLEEVKNRLNPETKKK